MPEKSNIWRDCVDGYYDWVKEHIEEVGGQKRRRVGRGVKAQQEGCCNALHTIDAPIPVLDWLPRLLACRAHR